MWFAGGNDLSFTRTERFSRYQDRPLIIWSPELTGCTVLAVVSRTAVYMVSAECNMPMCAKTECLAMLTSKCQGHFWQPLAFERHADRDEPNLQQNALNLITGATPLFFAEGTSLDPTLFGPQEVRDADGNTVLDDQGNPVTSEPYAAIMTPRYGTRTNNNLFYPQQIGQIADTVEARIGVRPIIYGYHSANRYNQGNGRRGAALFEYEWDADGEGNGDWRLWYEYSHESGRALGMFPQGRNLPN